MMTMAAREDLFIAMRQSPRLCESCDLDWRFISKARPRAERWVIPCPSGPIAATNSAPDNVPCLTASSSEL